MWGKSSSRVKGMEVVDMASRPKEEPRLSGAYIRSLVKHLSSSMTKDQTMNHTKPLGSTTGTRDEPQPLRSPSPPPPRPKKQVRRRLHTSRPYQERVLDMAEARREIVTALKFHRAAMKQANEHQPPPPQPSHDSRRSPNPNQPTFSYPTLAVPLPNISDNLNLPHHNQPLGLDLSFQGYNSNAIKDPLVQPFSPRSPSSSYSYSSPPMCGMEAKGARDPNVDLGDAKLHVAMDEEEMAEIRSIGEKHDIEWNDTLNLVTSAWWSKFLQAMEVGTTEGNGFRAFDGDTDVAAWLNDGAGGDANASQHLMQHLDDHCLHGASLPFFDIEDIDWLDGDWLS